MIPSRRGWLVAGLMVAVAGAGACKKDPDKTDPKQAEKGAEPGMARPDPGPAAVIKSGVNADDLSLLPRDSEVVAGINLGQLQSSALWKKFVEPAMMKGAVATKLAEFRAKCGFDPMSAIKSLSIGMKGIGGTKQDGVVVVHGPDKTKTLACFDQMKDEAAKSGDKIAKDGDIVTVTTARGDTFAMTFVNDTTAVAVVGANATADGVKAVASGASALKTSPAFVDMYNRIRTEDSVWMLMNGNARAFDQVQRMGIKPKAVYGSVNVSDGLSVDMRMRVDTPAQATELATSFKTQVEPFVTMVDKVDIVGDGSDIRFTVGISEQKLQQLVKTFGGMLGGMLGGMASQ